ncbi:MAG: Spy/CpxP family protein refolding chaperone [Steroidobacteraceae bacterium]
MSRSTRMISVALASLPLVAFTAAVHAANTASENAAPDAHMQGDARHWHHHDMHGHGPAGEAGLMSVLRDLDLTSAQKDQVHGILSTDRAQMKSERQGAIADLPALGNPGDPQHAAAVQTAAKRAADRVQHWNTLEQQVYAVLTPAQQAQLPKLLTDMQQRMAKHIDQDQPPADQQ